MLLFQLFGTGSFDIAHLRTCWILWDHGLLLTLWPVIMSSWLLVDRCGEWLCDGSWNSLWSPLLVVSLDHESLVELSDVIASTLRSHSKSVSLWKNWILIPFYPLTENGLSVIAKWQFFRSLPPSASDIPFKWPQMIIMVQVGSYRWSIHKNIIIILTIK